ncbi:MULTISPECIES: DUF3540 domain-containing protein [Pseudomonas]|uniref:DUF3540 domain-containing protein n=1 Tax=Pseudomonas nitroreducens TaxID=46680 RepID=A0A6G6IRI8_PSENT|nr:MULTISPECIES: DUF3540 domain-containing protein [Pseudomonas]MBG6287945.1 DUF3540 domain-containing protein [Pseudomonas nitroreducens]QIE85587.1 DUF3540 domain-containing protein [Pseudomonas nitroreducens]UCL87958.1 DUF3540 domain-containing protein [Pseudomonas sp. HS-18]WEX00064.1 DUF3540 domain-containing protein [Pseudomonas nitroreducens]
MNTSRTLLKKPLPPTYEPTGRIIETAGERGFLVARGQLRQICTQAFGCLVRPNAGDRVLLADVDGDTFILSVLERPGTERPTLRLPYGLDIESGAKVRITGTAVELAPETLRLRARELDCQAATLTYSCGEARGFIGIGKLVGRTLELLADKWVQISKQSFRISEQLECVRAGELDCEATQSLRLHGKNTLISADQLSKLDARQIHIG